MQVNLNNRQRPARMQVALRYRRCSVEFPWRENWEDFVESVVPSFRRFLVWRSDSVQGRHIGRCVRAAHPEQFVTESLHGTGLEFDDVVGVLDWPPLYSFRRGWEISRGRLEEGSMLNARPYLLMIDGVTRAIAVDQFHRSRPAPTQEGRPPPPPRPNWQELQRHAPNRVVHRSSGPSTGRAAADALTTLAETVTGSVPIAGQARRIIEGYGESMQAQYDIGRSNARHIAFVDHLSRWAFRAGPDDRRPPRRPPVSPSTWAERRFEEARTPRSSRSADYNEGASAAVNLVSSRNSQREQAQLLWSLRWYGRRSGGLHEPNTPAELAGIRMYIREHVQGTPILRDTRSDSQRAADDFAP